MGGRQAARIGLRGLARRGQPRGAVLALNGARPSELQCAWDLLAGLTSEILLVAVDGGLKTCRAARRKPDLFVGDGDSVARVPGDVETLLFDRDKAFSDLGGSLLELRRRRVRVVTVAGLAGGRLDHEWANLFELGRHASHFAGILAPTPRGTVVVTSEGCKVEGAGGGIFSVFALGGSATVTLRGAEWALERRRLLPGSNGLSNIAEDPAELTVHRGTVAFVLLPEGR
jgi:thiamine pyrophosphokinase